ncbi:MAG: ferric reductase-like transmembrane domain-containing protein [Kofleriaceae bacterium]|nr:ferric reductase-like transmembrane domain-containing protein [Kofleriaceae bacterium]
MTGPRLLVAISLAVAAMCAALVVSAHSAESAAHLVVRWTARTSLVCFALVYVARPANALWPSALTKRLLAERKWIGDGFAVSHLFHAFGIAALATLDWKIFMAARDAGAILGTLVFALVFAMAITSIDRIRRAMSRRVWRALHLAGMHLAWVVFVASYAKRLRGELFGPIALGVLGAIAVLRLFAWVRARVRDRTRARAAA